MNAVLLEVYNEGRKAHDASSVCDMSCHCGTYALSSSKFDGVRDGAAQLAEWVREHHPTAVAHYVEESKRKSAGAMLHLNFASEADLRADMGRSVEVDLGSRLVRCAGGDGKPCGRSVLSFPEQMYIHGSVVRGEVGKTTMGEVAKSVAAAIGELCGKAVLLDHISTTENLNGQRVISVRFHCIDDLRQMVS
jgi:hypothetical protein